VLEHGEVQVVSLREAIYQTGQLFENVTFVIDPQKLKDFIDENI